MSVCYSMGKTCKVCDSPISDNNTSGIGCECRYSYNEAKRVVFFDNKERGLAYFKIEVDLYLELFIEVFETVKFRSRFKKEFYPSIKEQYETKGYVSKKQLEICKDMLYSKGCEMELEEVYDEKKDRQRKAIEFCEFDEDEQEKIFNLANKFRHEFRANQKRG